MEKPTGSVLKWTIAVSVKISISVQNRHSRILLRILLRSRMREMHREHRSPNHSVKSGTLQKAHSTRPRVVADLGKSALVHIARLMNSQAKDRKRMMTKVQWLCRRRMSHEIER